MNRRVLPFTSGKQIDERLLHILTERENQLDKIEATLPVAKDLVEELLAGHLDKGYIVSLSNFLGAPADKLDELALFVGLLDDHLMEQKTQAKGGLLSLLRLRRPA